MKKHNPKKAKLITNGGFYKIIKINKVDLNISVPFSYQIQLNSPELYGMPVSIGGFARFQLEKMTKTMAIYKQVDAILSKYNEYKTNTKISYKSKT
jgi:hypothetical protein